MNYFNIFNFICMYDAVFFIDLKTLQKCKTYKSNITQQIF